MQIRQTMAVASVAACIFSTLAVPSSATPITAAPPPTSALQPKERLSAPDTALLRAAYSGHIDEVEQALAQGADVNARDAKGRTPLMLAVWVDLILLPDINAVPRMDIDTELEIVKKLLEHKADIDAQDDLGQTALLQACRAEDADAVSFLLDKGAKANLADKNGVTPLIYAAQLCRMASCRVLLKKGADVNVQAANGNSALIMASADSTDYTENGIDLVKLLLSKGANPNVKNKDGGTPLFYATATGSKQIIKLLKKYGAKA